MPTLWTLAHTPLAPANPWHAAIRDPSGAPVAHVWEGNPIAHDPPALPAHPAATLHSHAPLVIRSGWFGDPDATTPPGLYPQDHRTWSRAGWEAMTARLSALDALPGPELWVRPHARHVLSDPQGVLTAVRAWPQSTPTRLRLLVDPVGLLTEPMLDAAEDHLARALDALADHPSAVAGIITNARAVEVDDPDRPGRVELLPAPVHRGLISPALLRESARAMARLGLPIILIDDDTLAQRDLLGL